MTDDTKVALIWESDNYSDYCWGLVGIFTRDDAEVRIGELNDRVEEAMESKATTVYADALAVFGDAHIANRVESVACYGWEPVFRIAEVGSVMGASE